MFDDFFYKHHEPLLIIDRSLNLVECNRAAGAFFDAPRREIIGYGLDGLIETSGLEASLDTADIVDGWVALKWTCFLRGSILSCDIKILRMRPRDGAVLYAIELSELSRERSAFRQLRSEVENANDKAKRKEISLRQTEILNQKLSSFAHRAAHDLGGPLGRIRQCLEIYREETKTTDEPEPEVREFLDLAINSAIKLREQVNRLLAYSKASLMPVEKRPVRLDDIIHDAILLAGVGKLPEVSVTISADPIVSCDERLMLIVFQNLIENAMKYAHPDRALSLKIFAAEKDNHLCLSFQDNGLGFNPDLSKKIFDLFQRAHSNIEGAGHRPCDMPGACAEPWLVDIC